MGGKTAHMELTGITDYTEVKAIVFCGEEIPLN